MTKRRTPPPRIGLVLALACLLATSTPSAKLVAGVDLPSTVAVAGETLALASCGVRDTLWIEHYVAALYLRPGQPIEAMRDPAQPTMVLLHIVRAASLPEQIPEDWREPLREELKRGPLAQVRVAYGALGSGDEVRVTYEPDHGVSMAVNGRVVATAPSHELIDSMLTTWANGDPISGKLRRMVLKNPC